MKALNGRKLRIGTVGCGRMGANTSPGMRRYAAPHLQILSHLEAVRSLDLASELAASDIVPEALESARQKYALDFVTADYLDLIDTFRPDILTVATRTPDKPAIIAAAAAAGIKALHIEKPLCNSAAELDRIAGLIDANALLVTSGCLRRYLTPFRNVGSLFAEHDLGRPSNVTIGMGLAPLMWTQFHAIDLILFLAGDRRLETVQASLGPVEWKDGHTVENDPMVVSATLAFEDGFTGHIGQAAGNTTFVSATGGQLELFADGRSSFLAKRTRSDDPYFTKFPIQVESGALSGSQAPLWYLANALQGDVDAIALVRRAGKDFRLAQLTALAMVESDRQGGRRIAMPEFDTNLTILGKTDGRYA